MESIDENHLRLLHPGIIDNSKLLRPFDSYIRNEDATNTANMVVKS